MGKRERETERERERERERGRKRGGAEREIGHRKPEREERASVRNRLVER